MTNKTNMGYKPDLSIPPGETLQEYLDSVGMTQVELAKRTGLTTKTLNEIIKGKAPITPETSLKLESVFGTPASFWNNLEAIYQETKARLEAEKKIDKEAQTAALIPYKELAKHGFVRPTRKPRERVYYLRHFFGVASLDFVPAVIPAAFRKSDKGKASHYALASWIRMGELMASDIDCQPFDEKKLRETIPLFRALTAQQDYFIAELKDLCAACGVAMVVVPHLAKTYAQGATKWLHPGKAMLQLSTRYQMADIFWFSFFHELGHILLHGKKAVFAECGEKTPFEEEADRFAADYLIPAVKYRKFVEAGRFSRDEIMKFADHIGLEPGIVVGRLHHDKVLDWSNCYYLQKKIDLQFGAMDT